VTPAAASFFVAGGIVLLASGGEFLVRGSAAVARLARVTPAVIGLTIVSMGTSLPELVVSLFAALGGNPDVAVGNVVGSNIFNVGAILGIAALLSPLVVHSTAVRLEWPFMFVTSFVGLLLARDGVIDRLEGTFFVVSLLLFTVYVIRVARTEVRQIEEEHLAREVEARTRLRTMQSVAFNILLVVIGIALLVTGARLLVLGAVELAALAGMSQRVIGLTIVAAGTSLPELAASIVAALRKHTEIAIANIIGSNIFNILGILGTTALIAPVRVSEQIATIDMWWMLAFSAALLPMMRIGLRVGRIDALVLLGGYALYLWLLL